jgi:hypothetical protein
MNPVLKLPLNHLTFTALQLSRDLRELALQAYYQHPIHTAWRFFQAPNPWMHTHASYVLGHPEEGKGYAYFED